jgi:hypothetical protein
MKDVTAELAELKGLVAKGRETAGKRARVRPERTRAEAEPGTAGEATLASLAPERLEELVGTLRAVLDQPVEELEEAIASHPLGSAAAAFFLGVLVGRLLPRG